MTVKFDIISNTIPAATAFSFPITIGVTAISVVSENNFSF